MADKFLLSKLNSLKIKTQRILAVETVLFQLYLIERYILNKNYMLNIHLF